ncbi:MAG: hypothetical protein J7513_08570 [Solirubrobacteraceae bacterium]|nr:hypothetical protein [Solirubrobacteraceae bacterium]
MSDSELLLAPLLAVAGVAAPFAPPLRSASNTARCAAGSVLIGVATLAGFRLGLPELPGRELVARLTSAAIVLFLTTAVAGAAVGWLLSLLNVKATTAAGPPGTGRVIGMLERLLLAAVFPIGGAEAVAIVFAAKQLARLPAIQQADDDGATAEYILVGSLLSAIFGLAGGLALDAVLRT